MRINSQEYKAFAKACQKAGLKINNTIGETPSEGLTLVDARGNKYSVTTNSNLTKSQRIARHRANKNVIKGNG